MWTCPKCECNFKTANQSHSCVNKDIDDFFENKPPELLLAFEKLLIEVVDWEPNTLGPTQHTVVFTNKKAWLIVKPMSKELDVKFYLDEKIDSPRIKKTHEYNGKFAHHIRVKNEEEVDGELFQLIRKGYNYALK